jgi:hypothetical protein
MRRGTDGDFYRHALTAAPPSSALSLSLPRKSVGDVAIGFLKNQSGEKTDYHTQFFIRSLSRNLPIWRLVS